MKNLLLFLLIMVPGQFIHAKKLSFDFSMGVGYQPKYKLYKTGGAALETFTTRGFFSADFLTDLLFAIHTDQRIGLSVNLLSLPAYYLADITATQFAQRHPQRNRKSNMQSDQLAMDISVVYRKYFQMKHSPYVLFVDIAPGIRPLTSHAGLVFMDAIEGSDSVNLFTLTYDTPQPLNWICKWELGCRRVGKKNAIALSLYYRKARYNPSGTYQSMVNTTDFNYGTFKSRNQQFGLRFSLGIGN